KCLRKPTRSSAISTASRSVETPSASRASSTSRGSTQNASRTFPIRVARGAALVAPVRALRESVDRYVLLFTLRAFISRRSRRIQPRRLHERAVARRIPHGEPHPRFACRVEWNREVLCAERAQVGGRDHLAVDLLAVAPHHFDER